MPGSSNHDYRAAELDPELLSTPYGVQTNWHVTGAVCSGKTTLIDMLADKGFRDSTLREVAKGRTLDEIFGSEADRRVARARLQRLGISRCESASIAA